MNTFRNAFRFLLQIWCVIVAVGLVSEPAFAAYQAAPGLREHTILLLFLELAVLLLASLICGEVMVRLGQPAIIGQILAGVLLGQTVFGNFFPAQSAWLFPQDGTHLKLIEAFSWIGVSFVLMLTGMETDASTLKRLGKPALYFAGYGFIGPLLSGAAISFYLPERLISSPSQQLAFAVLLGTVFSAASVAVVGKVLMDMKLMRRDIGLLVLSATLAHDLLCCLLLAVIAVLSGSGSEGSSKLLIAVGGTICFVGILYIGRPVFFTTLRWINDKVSSSDGLITAMVALLLLCSAATEALGIHIVLGAFAAGVILSQAPVISSKMVRPLEVVTMGFFAPIFFASAALKVNMAVLCEPQLALITAVLCLTAMLSKLLFCCLAGKLSDIGPWESASISIGSNTKGSMGIILAMLGRALNIVTLDMVAVIIFISLFSTAAAPPLMKWALSKVLSSDEEKERIARLERRSRTILGSIRRVLWPTSGKEQNLFLAKLLGSISQQQILETTIFWANTPDASIDSNKAFKNISDAMSAQHASFHKRSVHAKSANEAIGREAGKGYDLIVMTEDDPKADAHYVFGPLVDGVIQETSTKCLVIHVPDKTAEREIKQVILPVSDSETSVKAGEFGVSLAKSLSAHVTALSVDKVESSRLYSNETRSGELIHRNISDEIMSSLAELSAAIEVGFESKLLDSSMHPAEAIIHAAKESNADLIVLGAEPKLARGLFLGHTINYVLRHAPCAVVILKL